MVLMACPSLNAEPWEDFEWVPEHAKGSDGKDTVVYKIRPFRYRVESPKAYSELGIDTIQRYIIEHEIDIDIYGYDEEKKLTGISLRAFKAWSRAFTGKNYPVLAFRLLPYEKTMRGAKIDGFDMKNVSFYPQYNCCDMERLLFGDKILVNVSYNYSVKDFKYIVEIAALIPVWDNPYTFAPIHFSYTYTDYLYWRIPKASNTTPGISAIHDVLKSLNVDEDGVLLSSPSCYYNLSEIKMKRYDKVTFNRANMPRDVRTLFDKIYSSESQCR